MLRAATVVAGLLVIDPGLRVSKHFAWIIALLARSRSASTIRDKRARMIETNRRSSLLNEDDP